MMRAFREIRLLGRQARMDIMHLMRSGLGIPDYWHPHVELQSEFLSGKLTRYPLTMHAKADYPGQLGAEGVPATFRDGKACTLPVNVTLFGLGSHDAFLATGKEHYHQQLIWTLRWLEDHSVPLGEGIGWPDEADKPVWLMCNYRAGYGAISDD